MEYISRTKALNVICDGCNLEFPEQPCEPCCCKIREHLIHVPDADVVERSLVEDKINWLRSRCRAGVEQYFDREQWDHLQIIDIRDSIAKRKVAEWIDVKFNYLYKCGRCNYYTDIRSKYCPYCGARMVNNEYTD